MAQSQKEAIMEKIRQLGDYNSGLSADIRSSANRNLERSGEILSVLYAVSEAVAALIKAKRERDEALASMQGELAEAKAQLDQANKDLASGLARAQEEGTAARAAAEREKQDAIAAAEREKEAALATAKADAEAEIARINKEKDAESQRFQEEMQASQRKLNEYSAAGQANSAQAQRLQGQIEQMQGLHAQTQAKLSADIERERGIFQSEKTALGEQYNARLSEAQAAAERARGEAVSAESGRCAEAIARYEAEIQGALDQALQNQAAFLNELSQIVPVQQLEEILQKLNALNSELGGQGGQGGESGGLFSAALGALGLGGQPEGAAPPAAAAQPRRQFGIPAGNTGSPFTPSIGRRGVPIPTTRPGMPGPQQGGTRKHKRTRKHKNRRIKRHTRRGGGKRKRTRKHH